MKNNFEIIREEEIKKINFNEKKLEKLKRSMALNEYDLTRLNKFKKMANFSVISCPLLFISFILTLPFHSALLSSILMILSATNFGLAASSIINLLKLGVYDKKTNNDFCYKCCDIIHELDIEMANTKNLINKSKKLVEEYDNNYSNELNYILTDNIINDDHLYLNNEYVKTK